jgi:hypothetical protein
MTPRSTASRSGKSLLMRGFPLSDGSVLVLAVGHVRTPCGRVVQRQYRDISRREYYRLARADRDTVGRPSCRKDAGRTQGVVIPGDGDALLRERLVASIAYARWGSAGAYEVIARRDPAVRQAESAFVRAAALVERTH